MGLPLAPVTRAATEEAAGEISHLNKSEIAPSTSTRRQMRPTAALALPFPALIHGATEEAAADGFTLVQV